MRRAKRYTMRPHVRLALALFALSATACGDDVGSPCGPGELGCECMEGTCFSGFVCRSELCVEDSDAGTPVDAGATDAGGTDAGATDAGATDAGVEIDVGPPDGGGGTAWSSPTSLVEDFGRLAIGSQVHIVGHTGGQLVHRASTDDGVTWSSPTVIAPASGNFPAMYGGLFAAGDSVYLLTAVANMASGPRQMDFRRSFDGGATWSVPVRITTPSRPIFRARIAASGAYVHVVGAGVPTPSGSMVYFRSVNGGANWEPGVVLAEDLGGYGGGQTVAVDGSSVHVAYTTAVSGVGGGPSLYIRSTDNGANWSTPISIGEVSAETSRQARVQLTAVDGRVFACWQREAEFTGAPLVPDRLGYNTSSDGGATWGAARVLPEDRGVNRNHQQVWMATGGGVHLMWRHGNDGPDPAGYAYSPDYGETWEPRILVVDTAGANHPFSIVADTVSVHVLTGPAGIMQYAYRIF